MRDLGVSRSLSSVIECRREWDREGATWQAQGEAFIPEAEKKGSSHLQKGKEQSKSNTGVLLLTRGLY